MIRTDRIRRHADAINSARETRYATKPGKEAWETMPVSELVNAVSYKLARAMQPNVTTEKRLDDLVDAYNYIAAIYERSFE